MLAASDDPITGALSKLHRSAEIAVFFYEHFDAKPLLQESWKLACIDDEKERVTQTYQAVLKHRGFNTPQDDGYVSPRLMSVRKIFN